MPHSPDITKQTRHEQTRQSYHGWQAAQHLEVSPMALALRADGRLTRQIVRTGQHFGSNMSHVCLKELGISALDLHFNCGGDSLASLPARTKASSEAPAEAAWPAPIRRAESPARGEVKMTVALPFVTSEGYIGQAKRRHH